MSGGRPPLTLVVITKDEEENLPGCLDSAAAVPGLVTDIVVLDSGSSDRTVAIARERGARVVTHPFDGHVQQKNRAVGLATTDWVLCLDADERLSPELAAEIASALASPELPDAFSMPRRTRYLGRWIDHGGWYPDRKVRLFRRDRARWGGVNPHDRVEVTGPVRELAGDIHHYTYRSISDHLRQIDTFTTIAARAKAEDGRRFRLWRLLVHPPAAFVKGYFLRLGFLDGLAGFVVAVMGCTYVFLKYAKLWERERTRERG